jgi:hypothetical protein
MAHNAPKSAGGKKPPPQRFPITFLLIHEHGEWVLVAKETFTEPVHSSPLFSHSRCSVIEAHWGPIRPMVGIKLRKPQEILALGLRKKHVQLLELVAAALFLDCPDKNERHFLHAMEGYAKVGTWLLHHPGLVVPDRYLQVFTH